MRSLLLKLDNWWYYRSPARINGLVRDVERLFSQAREIERLTAEVRGLRSHVTVIEAVIDRMGPRQASTPRRHLASVTPIRPAADQ